MPKFYYILISLALFLVPWTIASGIITVGTIAVAAPAISQINPFISANLGQFFLILGGAFLGGLILNVMPCVLPVLALKLHAMGQVSTLSQRQQTGWLLFGLFAAFLLFALLVYALQRAGQTVGWGFHFQQPVFVLLMMSLLLFFTFLQIGRLSSNSMAALQHGAHHGVSWFSPSQPLFHILYGGLIVLLATPCTAPFLGSAAAFALTQSLQMMIAIFMMIAAGLAVPWIILFLLPKKMSVLLRFTQQGKNFLIVKNLSALLLYGAALWMVWILSAQIGAAFALSLFVLLHLALWLYMRKHHIAIMLVIAAISTPIFLKSNVAPVLPIKQDQLVWYPFNVENMQKQIRHGKIVFVDIGADWCLTCQYNKANVLSDQEVRLRLAQPDMYLMFGDLTKPNKKITIFLKNQNRIGIPFNAIYHQHGQTLLSEILDKEKLLHHLSESTLDIFKTK